jgi:hypothetical protein
MTLMKGKPLSAEAGLSLQLRKKRKSGLQSALSINAAVGREKSMRTSPMARAFRAWIISFSFKIEESGFSISISRMPERSREGRLGVPRGSLGEKKSAGVSPVAVLSARAVW